MDSVLTEVWHTEVYLVGGDTDESVRVGSGQGCSLGRVSLQHLKEFGESGLESVVVMEVPRCAGQIIRGVRGFSMDRGGW